MAEIAVSMATDKLILLLRGKVTLLKGVHRRVTFIKDQLRLIRAYLKDADQKAEMGNTSEVVKEWVRQMREVSYNIEDVIDEYLFKVAKRRHRHGAVGVVCKIRHLLRTIIPRYEIASQVCDIRESIVRLNQGRETFGFSPSASQSTSHVADNSACLDLRLGAHFIEDAQLVGVDHTRDILINWLLNGDSRRTMISVVGEGGLGKTTVVKNVYNNEKDKRSFDCYAWINVSRSLKEEHLLRTLMQSFYKEDKNKFAAKEISETIVDKDNLIGKLREYLERRSYLIVFDDVREIDFWGGVEFALPESKSRIIITTRDKGVAEFCRCSTPVHIHELEPLHPNDALKLFLLKAFQFDPDGCPEELMGLSLEFVKKCDGVPLAIVAIASMLSTKGKNVSEWQRVYDSLRSKFSSDPHLQSFYQVLSESYHDLPYHLKLCLLYFGLFPEYYSISCVRLINLWIAEGFVKEKENEGQTLEEVAEEYLAELIRRSLVKAGQVYPYGRVRSCRVHDLMHDFILKRCEEMNFCQVKKSEGFSINAWTRRLSIHTNIEDATAKSASHYGRVQSCFLFNIQDMPNPVAKSLFSSFKLLIGLDCENAPLDYLPEAVGNLFHLKYLNVRNTKIKTIPKFIGKLQNLETLDLKHTQVRELPVEINRLVKLRHLLGNTYFLDPEEIIHGVKLKEGIRHIQALQTLSAVDATDEDAGVIREMKNLKQMRKLGITKLSKQNGKLLCNAIEGMIHLCSLSIGSTGKLEVLDLQTLTDPPQHLQRLYLNRRLEKLPEWILRLKNLVKLRLRGSRIKEDPLPLLKDLSELSELILWDTYESDELHFREGWFIKLKGLGLHCMPGLRIFKIDKGAMPLLDGFWLESCFQMVEVPSDIQNLEALKHVYLRRMLPQFLEKISTQKNENIVLHLFDDTRGSFRSL